MAWGTSNIPDQSGRVAIVTGANSGIGYETALALFEKGAHVVLACRDAGRGGQALTRLRETCRASGATERSELRELDLSSQASVSRFCADFRRDNERLDLLINNAGVMMCPYTRTEDGFELQLATNHLGHFRLTAELFELIAATPGSRVVALSSLMHLVGKIDFADLAADKRYDRTRAYAQSKLANLMFALELARRLSSRGIDAIATAAHPGGTGTNLQRHRPVISALAKRALQSAADGALPTLYAATAPEAVNGGYYGPSRFFEMSGPPTTAKTSKRARDEVAAARLWQVSEQMCGVTLLS